MFVPAVRFRQRLAASYNVRAGSSELERRFAGGTTGRYAVSEAGSRILSRRPLAFGAAGAPDGGAPCAPYRRAA